MLFSVVEFSVRVTATYENAFKAIDEIDVREFLPTEQICSAISCAPRINRSIDVDDDADENENEVRLSVERPFVEENAIERIPNKAGMSS
jgi:hypothetical protein